MQRFKKVFFITALALLILSVSIVSATNDTHTDSSTNDASSIEHTNLQKDAKVVKETTKSNIKTNKEAKNAEKQIIKENKTDENKKKDSIVIDGVEYYTVYENEYVSESSLYINNVYFNNCTIDSDEFCACGDIYINNSEVLNYLMNDGENLQIHNSILNCCFEIFSGYMIIDDNTVLGSSFMITCVEGGKIFTNNTQFIDYCEENGIDIIETPESSINIDGVDYTKIYENRTFHSDLWRTEANTLFNNCTFDDVDNTLSIRHSSYINTSYVNFNKIYVESSQLIINNTILNCTLKTNYNGRLIVDDDTTIGERFALEINNIDNLQTNNTDILEWIKEHMGIYIGNNAIENQVIDENIENNGNLTIRNSTIKAQINNNGNLTIEDDVIFGENCNFIGNGNYTISDINRIAQYMSQYYGEYNFNGVTIGNNRTRTNYGIVSFSNSILNSTIQNYGTLIISDDTVFGENFKIIGDGEVVINDTDRIFPYLEVITVDITLENMNITTKSFNANTTLINCNISGLITNNGNMTFINCSFSNNNLIDYNLLNNNGICTIDGCIIENNTFNSSSTYTLQNLRGAILNNGILTVVNTVANNNSVGFYYLEEGSSYKYGTVAGYGGVFSNYGNLSVDNSTFTCNYAGHSGAAIYNTGDLKVNNSIFENNLVNVQGGAISITPNNVGYDYTLKNVEICNSTFKNNNVYLPINLVSICGGGAIYASQTHTNITDCTFDNNKAYTDVTGLMGVSAQGGSLLFEHKASSSLINVDGCTFVNHETSIIENGKQSILGVTGFVTNCIFENNTGGLIDYSYLNIISNTFKNISSTDAVISNIVNSETGKSISNNTFMDNKVTIETIYTMPYGSFNVEDINIIVSGNKYINTTIDDAIELTIPNKMYAGEPVTIIGTYTINNPDYYDGDILEQNKFNVYLNGVLNQTVDTLEFTIVPTAGNNILTVQPTISQTRKSTSIKPTTLTNITITPENYNEYIYERSLIGVSKDSKIIFVGEFQDKGKIHIDTQDLIIDGKEANFINTEFILEASGITITNMNINNTETTYPIENTKDDNIIINNVITLTNTNGKTAAIYNKASNTLITNNTIYVDGPAGDINYEAGGVCTTQAILLLGGDQNTIENNIITITSTSSTSTFGTIEGITNSKEANNTIIKGNKLNVSGGMFNYGINALKNVVNMTITENDILVTGQRYADGIQVGNGAENILIQNNNIRCICQNTTPVDEEAITYGIVTSNMNGGMSNNITILDNVIDLTGSVNYGIEIYQTSNTIISNNDIKASGLQSMGIGYAHSPNATISQNNIKTIGNSNITLQRVTEEIQPANVGIQIQQESDNILITDNTVETYDKAGQDTAININSTNVTVKDNNLTSSTKTGDNAVNGGQDTTIEDNTAIQQESSTNTEEEVVLGESTTLTASFYDDTYTPISSGKAIFRVNGKTLRNDQGNVIYADVINGRAELPDVNITQEWTKPDTTIQAVYMGDNNNEPIITEKTPVTVTKPEATITLEAPTEAVAAQKITLKATVTDGDNAISSGRVAFKLNGKTLKNAEGKALYATVENGIATITYTIPEKTKAKEYTLTAVFTDTKYDRKETNSTLNVVKV